MTTNTPTPKTLEEHFPVEIANLVQATCREMTTGSAYETSNDNCLGFHVRHRYLTALAKAIASHIRAQDAELVEKLVEALKEVYEKLSDEYDGAPDSSTLGNGSLLLKIDKVLALHASMMAQREKLNDHQG